MHNRFGNNTLAEYNERKHRCSVCHQIGDVKAYVDCKMCLKYVSSETIFGQRTVYNCSKGNIDIDTSSTIVPQIST